MEIGILLIGIIIGVAVGWLSHALRQSARQGGAKEETEELGKRVATLEADKRNLDLNLHQARSELVQERQQASSFSAALVKERADRENLEHSLEKQQAEIEALQSRLRTEFENLANKIFEEKSRKFTEQNKQNMDQLLKPLGERLSEFREKVEKTYQTDSQDRLLLKREIENLAKLNTQISQDANNLTKALIGDSKTQGDWGEQKLEMILERADLKEGEHYFRQKTYAAGGDSSDEGGGSVRPDVVVTLPEGRCMIIDSKVSLTAYHRYCNSENPGDRDQAMEENLRSIRKHITELSNQEYQKIPDVQSPDYVLMFVPVDPALTLAVQADAKLNNGANSLFSEAFKKKVVIVTASTLFATLRMVAQIWKAEKQNRNAQNIANRAGELYDKFAGFVAELTKVGESLENASKSYEDAMKKLKSGRGNLIRQAEMLKDLGARTSKNLPQDLSDNDEDPGKERMLEGN